MNSFSFYHLALAGLGFIYLNASPVASAATSASRPDQQAVSYAEPDAQELARARENFEQALAYSYLPSRSGHLFFLSRKYFPVMFQTGDYAHDGYSMIKGKKVPNHGATHGTVWDYDTQIPILFYGPSWVKSGQEISTFATQQDLVPTYSWLMNTEPPRDAIHGRILHQAFSATKKRPKAILTVVFDQGGWQYYQAQPKAWPHVKKMMAEGSLYTHARINHLDAETAVGHIGIGTGAYPYQHGIISNRFFFGALGERSNLLGPERSPVFINSPSLADHWDRSQENKAIVISYAYADRAAIGMAGHGSLYAGGDKDTVLFYDSKSGKVTTNTNYYHLPDYLSSIAIQPKLKSLLDGKGRWHGHDVNNLVDVNKTPAQVEFDAEVFQSLIANEPIGQDDVTDLLYLTLKASDACGHAFGSESDECGEVFKLQDQKLSEIVKAFLAKVGREDALVVLTADHGGTPLTALSGGETIKAEEVKADLNRAFDRIDNGVDLVYDMLASQFYIDEAEMRRNGLTWQDLKRFVLDYQVGGKPAFLEVLTRREVNELQSRYGLLD